MRAIWYERYGGPEELFLRDVARPKPRSGELLVRVHACCLNGADVEMLIANPFYGRTTARGLFRPGVHILGSDVAGVVEEVGSGVDGFAAGDAVVGDIFEHFGGLAEYVRAPAERWVRKPEALGFVEASTAPQSGVLALQGIREQVELKPGDEVLIVGAGGGVGAYAVQLAKQAGATVTAVDNGHKSVFLTELGADRVVDHTRADPLSDGRTFTLILDAVAACAPGRYRRALEPGGACVVVGGPLRRVMGFALYGIGLRLLSDKRVGLLMWDRSLANLEIVLEGLAKGELRPPIDGVYAFDEAQAAFTRLTEKTAKGKVVLTPEGGTDASGGGASPRRDQSSSSS